MPAFVVYSTRKFCQRCFTPLVFWLVDARYLVNSMVNPLVYSFRMQIFKDALHEFWRKRQQNVRPVVQQNSLGFGLEGSFTSKLLTIIWTTRNGVITLWLYSIGDEVKALLEQITLKSTLLKGRTFLHWNVSFIRLIFVCYNIMLWNITNIVNCLRYLVLKYFSLPLPIQNQCYGSLSQNHWYGLQWTVVWLVGDIRANSMVNPLVNSFGMQIFKDALNKSWRKRRKT